MAASPCATVDVCQCTPVLKTAIAICKSATLLSFYPSEVPCSRAQISFNGWRHEGITGRPVAQ
eukprot:1147032-Pelagomonas_calceolata.AAC.2